MGDKIGSIESGKLADIIAVDENPVSNIKTMEKVNFVMKEGVVYKNGYTQIQVQGPRFKVKDRFQVSSPGFTCTSLLYFKLWTLDLEL